ADVVERLRIFDAVLSTKLAVAREEELLDVVPVGRPVVVSQQRELLVLSGELRTEARAVRAAWALRPVRAVRVDLLVDDGRDVDDPRDFGPARVVILFADGVRLDPRGELLGI